LSLGDLTWFKAIMTTLVIAAYGVVCCLVIGFYFQRQAEREKTQREPHDERVPVPTGE
jgi:ABC-type spermidine/putrescine transport system permease subunit I